MGCQFDDPLTTLVICSYAGFVISESGDHKTVLRRRLLETYPPGRDGSGKFVMIFEQQRVPVDEGEKIIRLSATPEGFG